MSGRFRCGDVAVAPEAGHISGPRGTAHVRPRSMEVFSALAEAGRGVASKRSLVDAVWGEAAVSEAALTNAIAELRRALAAVGGARDLIETVPKRGYRLAAAAEFDEPQPDPAHSLAVLPFEDLSPGRAWEGLVASLHEALVVELASVGGLRIVPRLSTAGWVPRALSLCRLGRELRVDRLVTGSLVGNGTRLRINAQLVDLVADRVRWSTSIVVAAGDPIEVPVTVARALAPELNAAMGARPLRPALPGLDPPIAERFLRGQFLLRGSTVARLEQGIRDLEEVARRRPDLAPAHAGLARGWFLMATWRTDPGGGALARAEREAARALALDAQSVEARVWLAMARAFARWRAGDAVEPLAGLVREHPHNPEARDALAHVLAITGRLAEAVAEERRALAEDPLSPALRAALGFFLRAAGDLPGAEAVLGEAVELHPEWTIARLELARVQWARGNREATIATLGAVDAAWAQFAAALAVGDRTGARAALEEFRGDAALAPYWLAERWLWAGEREMALHALERAFADRQLRLCYAGCDPAFSALAGDRRFESLLARAGAGSAGP